MYDNLCQVDGKLRGGVFGIICTPFSSPGTVGGRGTIIRLYESKYTLPDKHEVFKDVVLVLGPPGAEWGYKGKLPSIQDSEHICKNTTANLDTPIFHEPQIHRSVMHHSVIGVPITMFSCRRELLNAMLDIVSVAFFHGISKGVLHSDWDLIPNNMMLGVTKLDVEDVILDWPQAQQDQDGHLGQCGYIERAGLLHDWGLTTEDPTIQSDQKCANNSVFVPSTIRFVATDLLGSEGISRHVTRQPHHHLEYLFWVLWTISINYSGPCGKKRLWSAYGKPGPIVRVIDSDASSSDSAYDSDQNAGPVAIPIKSCDPSPHSCSRPGNYHTRTTKAHVQSLCQGEQSCESPCLGHSRGMSMSPLLIYSTGDQCRWIPPVPRLVQRISPYFADDGPGGEQFQAWHC
ncbi:hypothetical protein OG21DRAFT_905680 [Imleria badia]|nr:hypothetical protein OG21DRAFT_905680 [Imleria badia]